MLAAARLAGSVRFNIAYAVKARPSAINPATPPIRMGLRTCVDDLVPGLATGVVTSDGCARGAPQRGHRA